MAVLLAGGAARVASAPLMKVLNRAEPGLSLLSNGGFEIGNGPKLSDWQSAPRGYRRAPGEGRQGSSALACENPQGDGWAGASQTIRLDRTNAAPLIVRGWSQAENVGGSADTGYSLYADLIYADGTTLWGQTANFACGTHDWQQRSFIILPEKPVKSVTLHCLFRGHSGNAWFDDVAVEEIQSQAGAVVFQGTPLSVEPVSARPKSPSRKFSTRNGLTMVLRDNTVASLRIAGKELAARSPSGFMARDVAANSDFFGFSSNACPELGLKLQTEFIARSNHIVVQGRISDNTRRDRAITLVFALPLDANGWRWGDDIRRERTIAGQGEYVNQTVVRCGSTGTLSLYPLAAINTDHLGLAIALDLAKPAQYRLGYHAGTKQLFVAYDFGLAPETQSFPGSADFRFIIYSYNPTWGFRSAFDQFTHIFPEFFLVRAKDQGIWMPFTDIRTVEGWQDFGFKYHEGNNNVPFDDAHGILSFRYTEPMTWWMPMDQNRPRTLTEALKARDALAQNSKEPNQTMARIAQFAAMRDESGQPALLFRNEPWCRGAVWSLNPNPYLAVPPLPTPGNVAVRDNAATAHWNDKLKTQLYGAASQSQLDGEYLDSLEGYVTADLNFDRNHFRATTVPLSFDSDTKKPALFKGLAIFEFTRWFCDDVHRLGKLTFANSVPHQFAFLCPWLDVMGNETDWQREGQYRPAADSQMCLWRTMSGQKPYLLLMNTDYNVFTSDRVEKYFQRCLFYGIFPSMFSHNAADNPYWQNPKWYNRDRALFKKYQPVIKRVAESGWQPVTGARCSPAKIQIERFGLPASGPVYFTAYNDTTVFQTGILSIDPLVLKVPAKATFTELLSGKSLVRQGEGWPLSLQPGQVMVVEVRRP